MPLMQLSTLVLPAPLGPISANSSPAATANDTSSITTRPPNRSVRRSTTSLAIPPPAAAVLFDGAVAPARTARLPEIEFLDVRMAAQPRAAAVEHDAAVLQHVAVIGDFQRRRGALLDHQDGELEFAPDLDEAPHQLADDGRAEP